MARFIRLRTGTDHDVLVNVEHIVLVQPVPGAPQVVSVTLSTGETFQGDGTFEEVAQQITGTSSGTGES